VRFAQWLLFFIVNMLLGGSGVGGPSGGDMGYTPPPPPPQQEPADRFRFAEVQNSSFRILYRFIVLGIRGFTEDGVSTNASFL
jgi:hypothetical protein